MAALRRSRSKVQDLLRGQLNDANIESLGSLGASMCTTATTAVRPLLSFLRPSFLGRHHIKKPRKLHPTSYLDGLRGVAALFVVFNHYVSQFFPQLAHGWRSTDSGQDQNDRFLQLPILRTIYSGRFMVTIFFVISGYVLSHKALGLVRQRQFGSLLKTLSSSVFRRWIRLMIPALTSLFIGFLLVRFRLATTLYSDWNSLTPLAGTKRAPTQARLPDRMESTGLQFLDWMDSAFNMVDPFQLGNMTWPKYNIVLWTMPVEYLGSMIVFVTVLGTALIRSSYRLPMLSLLVAYCIWSAKWQWSLFISGVLLAELSYQSPQRPTLSLDTGIDDGKEKTPASQVSSTSRPKIIDVIPDFIAFLFALYIGTYPEFGAEFSPGYQLLSGLIPTYYENNAGQFYPMLSAIIIVFLLENGNNKFLQNLFTTRIAQYLGDISLSLYMLHTHVELSLGNWVVPKCLSLTTAFGSLNFFVGMSMALACCAMVTLWVSDLFWRLVDTKSVKFARWVSEKCFIDDD